MKIKGLQKLTLLDYKGYLAATVFTGSCNFRCPFCHNKDLVLNPKSLPDIPEKDILSFLERRKNKLEGICITGGEPTLQPDLCSFIQKIKVLGYKVKLDTNGYRPDILTNLISKNLLDYIAMDIKNSKEKYTITAGIPDLNIQKLDTSIDIIMHSGIPYEFRTTIVKELHTENDIKKISSRLQGATTYYLQAYHESENIINPIFSSYSIETLMKFKQLASKYIEHVDIVGL